MKKDTSTVLDALVTRASLTDAILELVKESGLLKPRKKRHYTKKAKGNKKVMKRVAKPAVKREARVAPRPSNGRDQDERPVRRTVEPTRATRSERELEDRD